MSLSTDLSTCFPSHRRHNTHLLHGKKPLWSGGVSAVSIGDQNALSSGASAEVCFVEVLLIVQPCALQPGGQQPTAKTASRHDYIQLNIRLPIRHLSLRAPSPTQSLLRTANAIRQKSTVPALTSICPARHW